MSHPMAMQITELHGLLTTAESGRRSAEALQTSLQQRAAAAEAAMSELDQRQV